MQKCKLISISSLISLWILLSQYIIIIDNAPIVPILTALAASAVGLFQIQIDTLHIAKYIRDASHHKRNRGAFVRDLLYTAFYRSGQEYNVIVFNLAEEHQQQLYGVNFYGSVAFTDGTRFGIWVFEHGKFENHGARGWHNWGMIGSFKKSKDGATIYFRRRHRSSTTTIATTLDSSTRQTSTYLTTTTTASTTTIAVPIVDLKIEHLQQVPGSNKIFSLDNIEIKNESKINNNTNTTINSNHHQLKMEHLQKILDDKTFQGDNATEVNDGSPSSSSSSEPNKVEIKIKIEDKRTKNKSKSKKKA